MPTPNENLARSLDILLSLQKKGHRVLRSSQLGRVHRERLSANGYLEEAIKGWWIPRRPDGRGGDTITWYASFWDFCSTYLTQRFGRDWHLSAEQSLLLHADNTSVPKQLVIVAARGSNNTLVLPHGTSIFDYQARELPQPTNVVERGGLRLLSLPLALIKASPDFFVRYKIDAQVSLGMIKDSSELLAHLLAGGHSKVAGRLAGALRCIGREAMADQILSVMRAAGYVVPETNPFDEARLPALATRSPSPYVARIEVMWQSMRKTVIADFPAAPGLPAAVEAYLRRVDEQYTTDAYHSLSIEGYSVSHELIDRVRSGKWNPEAIEADKKNRAALAARGYWQAFQAVRKSLREILSGGNPGRIAERDHREWYREMFQSSVTAGLLKPSDLAGYRSQPVYIQGASHVPPSREAVLDAMPAFFRLLEDEEHPAVRAALGHFIFVYVHPYPDGNGRIARFLMNAMLASGGYPWTVIKQESRSTYFQALSAASSEQNIAPFAGFLGKEVRRAIGGPGPSRKDDTRKREGTRARRAARPRGKRG